MKSIFTAFAVLILTGVATAGYALYVPMERGAGDTIEDLGPAKLTAVDASENVDWANDPNRGTVLNFAEQSNIAVNGLEFPGYYGIGGNNPWTVSLWFKTPASAASNGLVYWGKLPPTAGDTCLIKLDGGQLRIQHFGGYKATALPDSLADDRWHHVAVVLPDMPDARIGDVRLYVDGVEVLDPYLAGSGADVFDIITDPAGGAIDLRLGDEGRRAPSCFVGLMDDFRMYDVALTGDQIRQVHEEYVQLVAPPLATGVHGDADCQWGSVGWMSASSYDVYFGTDQAAVENKAVAPVNTADPLFDPGTLPADTWHYWRVDAHGVDPNGDGTPMTFSGPLWSFRTLPPNPAILTQPVDSFVAPGEQAALEVVADFTDTYAWYRAEAPAVPLVDGPTGYGSTVAGATTSQLTITDAQPQDQDYYYCVCSAAGNANPATSDQALLNVEHLVAHWKMDEPLGPDPNTFLRDYSIEENHLTIVDNVGFVTGRDGADSGAAWFNGQNSRIDAGGQDLNFIPVKDRPYTISAHVYVQGANAFDTPLAIVGWGEGFVGAIPPDSYQKLTELRILVNLRSIQDTWYDADLAYRLETPRDGFSSFTGRWVHVASTFDPSTRERRLYVNGSLVATTVESHTRLVETTANFGLGYVQNNNVSGTDALPFHGAIDDVKIWNYPLSPVELALEYHTFTGDQVCMNAVPYDTNGDCLFNLADLAAYINNWLECNLVPDCLP